MVGIETPSVSARSGVEYRPVSISRRASASRCSISSDFRYRMWHPSMVETFVYPVVIDMSSGSVFLGFYGTGRGKRDEQSRVEVTAEFYERWTAWSPCLAVGVVAARGAENIPKNLAGSIAGHHDHRPESYVLEGDGQALVVAISRHPLGLIAEVAKVIGWRHCHEAILSQLKHAAQ